MVVFHCPAIGTPSVDFDWFLETVSRTLSVWPVRSEAPVCLS